MSSLVFDIVVSLVTVTFFENCDSRLCDVCLTWVYNELDSNAHSVWFCSVFHEIASVHL